MPLDRPKSNGSPARPTGPDDARLLEGAPDEQTRQRRKEFARMLLGAVRPTNALPPESPPIAKAAPPDPRTMKSTAAAVGDPTSHKVLVIEDDPVIRDMVVQALSRENCVYQAADGALGLALLQQIGPVDTVVCDVMMPHMDGFEFARRLKATPDLSSVPILFLTARGEAKAQVEGIQLGARAYLTKPFKVKQLMQAVARVIRASR
jgi:CheY-like chemotaxis protein